jgi:hypothetical protein
MILVVLASGGSLYFTLYYLYKYDIYEIESMLR